MLDLINYLTSSCMNQIKMGDYAHRLGFGHLPKVEDLLKSELSFLKYDTPLRNLCYDLQFLFFLEEMLKNKEFYGGFKTKLQYERLKACFTVCEALLYLALKDAALLSDYFNDTRFPVLCEQAESANIISGESLKKLNNLRRLRNKHHPGVQRDLHIKMGEDFTPYNYNFAIDLIHEIKTNLHPSS